MIFKNIMFPVMPVILYIKLKDIRIYLFYLITKKPRKITEAFLLYYFLSYHYILMANPRLNDIGIPKNTSASSAESL